MSLNYTEIFGIKSNNEKPSRGKILISEPFSVGDIFRRSVVLLTEYTKENGAMGFILNKSIDDETIIKTIADDFKKEDISISIGGPVGTEQMYYIHKLSPDILEGSVEISNGLYWGGEYSNLKKLVLSGNVSLNDVRFFVGYSGWAQNQLESELKRNSWLVKDINIDEIFRNDTKMWQKQIRLLEEKYKFWTLVPEDPILN
jgi:putative transcriptional regulator